MSANQRLDDIQAVVENHSKSPGGTYGPGSDVAYLLAELRNAHEALGRVEALADKWESLAGPGSEAERIYKVEQKVSVAFAVARIRAAVAAAKRVS